MYKDLPASDPDKPRLAAFAEKYTAKTGKPPTQNAAVGYDMLFSITEALKTAGTDSMKLRDALEAQSGAQLLTGIVKRSASEHNGMTSNWVIVGIDHTGQFRPKE